MCSTGNLLVYIIIVYSFPLLSIGPLASVLIGSRGVFWILIGSLCWRTRGVTLLFLVVVRWLVGADTLMPMCGLHGSPISCGLMMADYFWYRTYTRTGALCDVGGTSYLDHCCTKKQQHY